MHQTETTTPIQHHDHETETSPVAVLCMQAVDVWARSFAALGIGYRGSTMTLDLLDREKKYSNGFW